MLTRLFIAYISFTGICLGSEEAPIIADYSMTPQFAEPIKSGLQYHTLKYHFALRTHLLRDPNNNNFLNYYCMPSFNPEILLSCFRSDDGKYYLETQIPKESIWGKVYDIEDYEEIAAMDMEVTITTREITKTDAINLRKMWNLFLEQTSFQVDKSMILDGTSYMFMSYHEDMGVMAGEAANPHPATIVSDIVYRGDYLIEFVHDKELEMFDTEEQLDYIQSEIQKVISKKYGQSKVLQNISIGLCTILPVLFVILGLKRTNKTAS